MKRILLLLSFCFLLLPMLHAQKVGLVLSGGGAKGMTHIGIIRALEENNIYFDMILALEFCNKDAGAAIASTIPIIIHA